MSRKVLFSIFALTILVVSLVACKKDDENLAPARELTSAESNLLGRWQLVELRDTSAVYDTGVFMGNVYTLKNDYTNANFIEFTSNPVDADLAKKVPKALYMNFALSGGSPTMNYWYAPDSRMIITGGPTYDVVSLSASRLEISTSYEAFDRFGSGQRSNSTYILKK